VLVAADDLERFASFSVTRAESPASDAPAAAVRGSYAVKYGEWDGAVVEGFPGLAIADLLPPWDGCGPASDHCTDEPRALPTSIPAGSVPPPVERFQNLRVHGLPAAVSHTTCCNGVYWDVYWMEPTRGMLYHVGLTGAPAEKLGTKVDASSAAGRGSWWGWSSASCGSRPAA
jgi:hypothetical protein